MPEGTLYGYFVKRISCALQKANGRTIGKKLKRLITHKSDDMIEVTMGNYEDIVSHLRLIRKTSHCKLKSLSSSFEQESFLVSRSSHLPMYRAVLSFACGHYHNCLREGGLESLEKDAKKLVVYLYHCDR